MKKTILITGALSGIGNAATKLFSEMGYNVVFSGRRPEEGEVILNALKLINKDVLYVNADMNSESDIKHLIEVTLERFDSLDVAVNCAGTVGETAEIQAVTQDNFHLVFNTNVLGTLLAMKYQIPVMVERRKGSIINISSIAGIVGLPNTGIYVASKHAIEGLTKTAALEVATTGVRVNSISPGPVEGKMFDRFLGHSENNKKTFIEMMPNKRFTTQEEVAHTIFFLAEDNVTAITGQTITIDGGYTAQ
ncbi:SDR family NAD(P)-dependent oxidoreductase [Yersinia sp. 2545 StPb PI]|uniref:SDR family NAD(P)-dependent oxidoreductase n=1 Tax=Yersinia sp. 2545 StPb PI TaxID=3117410 RepID=UPI003FA4B9CA